MFGKSHSDITKKQMSDSGKGRKVSEETREKIRIKLKGRVYSQETLIRMREGQLGRKMSEETKKKMSESHKGEKHYMWRGGPRICDVINSAKRRARKKEAQGNISQAEWISIKGLYGNSCLSCGKTESEITLTMDHVIPLSVGGNNSKENIQPLCGSCNSKKRTKHIDYRPTFAERATA
jgi:5-methylcytosine-specific restriction endonuclease McrA